MQSSENPKNVYTPDPNSFDVVVKNADGNAYSRKCSDWIPKGLCAHLAHSLVPYLKTFSEGGSFPWMTTIDPNSVDVQCPNPSGAVAVRLTRDSGSSRVRVLNVRGICPLQYKAGDEIEPPNRSGATWDDLNVLLEWLILLNAFPDRSRTPDVRSTGGTMIYRIERRTEPKLVAGKTCPPRTDFNLELGYFTRRCRYHKFPKRGSYDNRNWIPEGLCPELFHAAYPLCLSSLYGGKPSSDSIRCPNEGAVGAVVRVEDRPLAFLRRAAMRGLRFFGKNTEIPSSRLHIKITDAGENCAWSLKPGTSFEFNMGELNQICPATFHNSYPVLAARFRGAAFPWENPPESMGAVQCPDHVCNITLDYRDAR